MYMLHYRKSIFNGVLNNDSDDRIYVYATLQKKYIFINMIVYHYAIFPTFVRKDGNTVSFRLCTECKGGSRYALAHNGYRKGIKGIAHV